MTPEEFTKALPTLTNDSLPIKPPFEFNNLSARIFPLRASLDALQQVCNGYLNFVPPEVGRFRAVVPYVYLAMLDYGRISELVKSIGWFAQVEVFFCVPVEWYKVVNGKWVFHDWAVITPFIYVDDDFSVPMGRTVYGFPKTLAHVTKASSQWLSDPVAPVTLARVETAVFPELYKGKRLESRVFLEVERDAPMSNFQLPGDPRSPMAPWVVASNLAQAMAGLGRDAMWLAQSMRIFQPNPGTNQAFGAEMLERMVPAFAPGGPGFVLNSVNLKQFRSSDATSCVCYQALTNGRMQMMAFNGGGILGEDRTFLGDLSGGYTIKLHEYSSLPITRTLGLEVHRRWQGDGVGVASLKPVMPFWLDLNVMYQQGMNLVWRTHNGIWRGGSGETLDQPAKESGSPLFNTTVASAVDDAVTGPFQFTGTTIRVLPLLADRKKLEQFLDVYINDALRAPAVYPDRPGEQHVRLSLWFRPEVQVNEGEPKVGGDYAYVYMTASSFSGVTSKTNNIGDWAKYELSFLIPVKWERRAENGEFEVQGVGLVPAYSFVDDTTAAVSRSEVQGIPTTRAKFVRPESVWLREGEADFGAKQTLLRVEAEVIPALGVGQQTAMHPVIEISQRDSDAGIGEPGSPATPAEWAEKLRLELGTKKGTKAEFPAECKVARALALELLGNRMPVALYTLKQFRDVADPGKACYQSLVRVSRVFDEVFDVREIEETIRVRIHDFPSLNLVERLGIEGEVLTEDGTGITHGTQAIRPFYIRATIDEPLGERLLSRAGTLRWEIGDHAFQSLLGDDGSMAIKVDGKAELMQDQGDPCQMNSIMYQSAQRRRKDGKEMPSEAELTPDEEKEFREKLRELSKLPLAEVSAEQTEYLKTRKQRLDDWKKWRLRQGITKTAAREALKVVDPQTVIESVLSREWGNFDRDARWRRGYRDLVKTRGNLLSGGSTPFARLRLTNGMSQDQIDDALTLGREDFASVEAALYQSVRKDKVHHPGTPHMGPEVDDMIRRMKEFTILRLRMDYHFNILLAWSIPRSSKASDPAATDAQLVPWEETNELVAVMREIKDKAVIGVPSKDDHLDPQVLADWYRLEELLKVFPKDKSTSDQAPLAESAKIPDDDEPHLQVKRLGTAIESFLASQTTEDPWRLTGKYREAVQLARKYCDAQREALLNKLSRAYQKPDFCIRRDSVGPDRDRLLPITLSWDEDWYVGRTFHEEGT